MLNHNLKTIRQAKGISQEELAIRLHVVRQTVSKWEKGLSVPDADMLIKIADVFEISVGDLLETKIQNTADTTDIAGQLSRINEQLAIKNRRSRLIWKVILGILICAVLFSFLFVITGFLSLHRFQNNTNTEIVMKTELEAESDTIA